MRKTKSQPPHPLPLSMRVCTIDCAGPGFKFPDNDDVKNGVLKFSVIDNYENYRPPVYYFQSAFDHFDEDIMVFAHDDLTIHDKGWYRQISETFATQPRCLCIGFGGAYGLGVRDLYKKPYKIDDLARQQYISNQTDAETHGERIQDIGLPFRVTVLDAFFIAIRRSLFDHYLHKFPTAHLTHHCIDLWLACEAKRHNLSTLVLPVSCTHHGGGTSIKPVYANCDWLQGGTIERDHQIPHEWIYDQYRDILPILPVNF